MVREALKDLNRIKPEADLGKFVMRRTLPSRIRLFSWSCFLLCMTLSIGCGGSGSVDIFRASEPAPTAITPNRSEAERAMHNRIDESDPIGGAMELATALCNTAITIGSDKTTFSMPSVTCRVSSTINSIRLVFNLG